jgi:hypothetical protein
MKRKPKPWIPLTPQRVGAFIKRYSCKQFVQRINDELIGYKIAMRNQIEEECRMEIQQLKQQLAVLTRESDERDKREAEYAQKMVAEIQVRDKQLANERELVHKQECDFYLPLLDAERKKVEQLVQGLHRLYALRDVKCDEQARRAYEAALSKEDK